MQSTEREQEWRRLEEVGEAVPAMHRQVHTMEANLRDTFLGKIYHRLGIRGGRKKDIKNDHSVRISVEKNGVLTD